MKASPNAAIQFIAPGETISAKEQNRRRRRAYMRGVLSSFSEFIAVRIRDMYLIVDDASEDKWLCSRMYVRLFVLSYD